jgi:probable blue pigment (indigoidine) exporter
MSDMPEQGTVRDVLITTLAPAIWGSTYLATVILPPDRPLLASLLRALPAGLVLLAVTRRLPTGHWWWRSAVLGLLNVGVFFPLLFFAAYRLPGGVAATVGAIQPLIVAALSAVVLRVGTPPLRLFAALVGAGGVALLTLTSAARLDPLGVAAMVVATGCMGTAIVLGKRWGGAVPPLRMAAWQLTAGGIVLLPLTFLIEGLPPTLSGLNVLGYSYLTVVGGALSYGLWFRGVERLPATSVSLLSLGSPMVATLIGFLVLSQDLTDWQSLGFTLALGALVVGSLAGRRRPARTEVSSARAEPRCAAQTLTTSVRPPEVCVSSGRAGSSRR